MLDIIRGEACFEVKGMFGWQPNTALDYLDLYAAGFGDHAVVHSQEEIDDYKRSFEKHIQETIETFESERRGIFGILGTWKGRIRVKSLDYCMANILNWSPSGAASVLPPEDYKIYLTETGIADLPKLEFFEVIRH